MGESDEDLNEVRKGFSKFYIRSSHSAIRIGLGVSTIFFALFGFVDPGGTQVMIRFGIVIPVMITAFALSYTRLFESYSQAVLSMAYFLISAGLIVMIRVTGAEEGVAREVYSIGLTLCIIGASAVRLRMAPALISTTAVLGLYLIVNFSTHDIYIHFPIFVTAAFITVLYIASTEKILKDNYTTFVLLNEERKSLKAIKERLEESDGLKTKLLSIIAHDLKGPTDNVAFILDLLNSYQITQDEFETHIGKLKLQLQGNRMLLENLLKWSVMKTDNRAQMSKVNIHELVNECIMLLQESASRKGNEIHNKVEEAVITTDPDILKMVIRNLLSNSIKYTDSGTVICTSSVGEDNSFSITVKDNGRGMEKENAERLFNWNKRISTPGTLDEKGSGIGLLICAEFLKSLGGHLKFYTVPGKGTAVTIGLTGHGS